MPKNRRNITKQLIIEEGDRVHNSFYDYAKTVYKNAKTLIIISCPLHGDFEQRVHNHLRGQGCPECGSRKISDSIKLTNKEFLEKARKIHGDSYDYSKSVYTLAKNKIIIICPVHGQFKMTGNNHLMGQGCPKCGIIANGEGRRKTKEEFLVQANQIHNNFYDYSKVEYSVNNKKVTIICPIHGGVSTNSIFTFTWVRL